MSDQPPIQLVRCGDCHEQYRYDLDLLTNKLVWIKPKVKRGKCTHPSNHVQVLADAEHGWQELSAP